MLELIAVTKNGTHPAAAGAGGFRAVPPVGIRNTCLTGSKEDAIKAALRQLTHKTRQLRRELEELINRPHTPDPRAFTHDRPYSLRTEQPPVTRDRVDERPGRSSIKRPASAKRRKQ